jgi:hypothetical protein
VISPQIYVFIAAASYPQCNCLVTEFSASSADVLNSPPPAEVYGARPMTAEAGDVLIASGSQTTPEATPCSHPGPGDGDREIFGVEPGSMPTTGDAPEGDALPAVAELRSNVVHVRPSTSAGTRSTHSHRDAVVHRSGLGFVGVKPSSRPDEKLVTTTSRRRPPTASGVRSTGGESRLEHVTAPIRHSVVGPVSASSASGRPHVRPSTAHPKDRHVKPRCTHPQFTVDVTSPCVIQFFPHMLLLFSSGGLVRNVRLFC